LSINANVFIAQEKSRYSNELKKIETEHRKALGKSQLQEEEITKLQSKLEEMQTSTKATADRSSAQHLNALMDRFRALEKKHHAVQLELDEKRSLEPRLTALGAERDAIKTDLSTCETKIKTLTKEIDRRNTDLLQARGSEERTRIEPEELRNQNQSEVDGMRRKLSQAEEKTKYAEAGIVQMKSSAEKTIREEQERHRKQQEALQQRLDEAQSELQMKSEEADDHRAFVERTVTQQQAVWQRLNADLETKASDIKAQLEDTSRLLRGAQEEQDTLQTTIASLQAEVQQLHKSEAEYRSREETSQATMDGLRQQLDAAKTEIASLQAIQQRYLREKDERSSREARAKSAYDTLRKDHEATTAAVADFRASEKQSQSHEAERKQREVDMQRQLDDMRNERDIAQATVKELHAKRHEMQIPHSVDADESYRVAPQPEFGEDVYVDEFVPPPKPECSVVPKQRKRADRNTNTIVGSGVAYGRAATQPTRPTRTEALQTRAQVVIPAKPALNTTMTFLGHDEMLDVVSSQPERINDTQISGYQSSNKSTLQGHTEKSQPFSTSLDFSGKPLVATKELVAKKTRAPGPSQSNSGSDFKIYEDAQNSLNEDEESSVRAKFTFRKPYPLPNSGSKRLKRTASEKSLGGHSASSRGTRRTPENSGGNPDKQVDKTPEASVYPYGSSPEFMNPPSTMTKRRYSGGPTTPGTLEPLTSRRPSTPLLDPRIAKRAVGNKRAATGDTHPDNDLEPPTKKRAVPTAKGSRGKPPSDDSFLGRSSQSVNDLPRIEDLNTRRGGGQIQSSNMRTSAGSRRVTRNQKGSKGQYNGPTYT
jgi:hypothetical protein